MIAKTKIQINSSGDGKSVEVQQKLQSRAARFGTVSDTKNQSATITTNKTTPVAAKVPPKPVNPADAEKLAARAARFGDLASNTTGQIKPNVTKAAVASNPADVEKFAKRAARFADIPAEPEKGVKKANTGTVSTKTLVNPTSTTTTPVAATKVDGDLLAKRAARFAGMATK